MTYWRRNFSHIEVITDSFKKPPNIQEIPCKVTIIVGEIIDVSDICSVSFFEHQVMFIRIYTFYLSFSPNGFRKSRSIPPCFLLADSKYPS